MKQSKDQQGSTMDKSACFCGECTYLTLLYQNIDEIHGLGGTVSMATSGAVSVEGGNFKIFENFVNKSGAKLYLNSTVSLRGPPFSTPSNILSGTKHHAQVGVFAQLDSP